MLFSSPTFLFLFLPLVLFSYFVTPRSLSNAHLLLASLAFYAWGCAWGLPVLGLSVLVNYALGMGLGAATRSDSRRTVVVLALLVNLGVLGFYKYWPFAWNSLAALWPAMGLLPAKALPLGISFYTFHALSYLMDIQRGESRVERNPFRLALYIILFPQLLSGPIVRYHQIEKELKQRHPRLDDVAEGTRRLIAGLAKKVLLADALAQYCDPIFACSPGYLTTGAAWLGAIAFSLQLYFDFSGYSDMAIGMGRMLGFHFPENFNYPYSSCTISEFWTRWHMSLTGWFRNYVFLPLTRDGSASPARIRLSMMIVFVLVGIWHGATWNCVVFGLVQGLITIVESAGLARWLARRPLLGRTYTLLLMCLALVWFRCPTLSQASDYQLRMLRVLGGPAVFNFLPDPYTSLILTLAALSATPLMPWLEKRWGERPSFRLLRWGLLLGLLLLSFMGLAASTHRPFIYFEF